MGISSTVAEIHRAPAWVAVIDALALQALRTHVQVEFDLRAVLRSKGPPGEVLERAGRILAQALEVAKRDVVVVRALLILNWHDLYEEDRRRVAEQVVGMHLLLLARFSGWASVGYFRQQRGEWEALEAVRMVGGLIPQCMDLESDTRVLFDSPSGAGIPAA